MKNSPTKPVSEISSVADSGDDSSVHNQIIITKGSVYGDFEVHESFGVMTNMADTALPAANMALPDSGMAIQLTPGKIQTSNVPLVELPQTTSSVSGTSDIKWLKLVCSVRLCRTWPYRLRPCRHLLCSLQCRLLLCRLWLLHLL